MKLQRVMIMLMMVEGIERITIFGDELILFVVVDFRSVYAGCGICCHNSSGVSTWFQGPLMDEDKNVGKLKMKVRYHSSVMKPFSMYICWPVCTCNIFSLNDVCLSWI